MEIQFQGFSPVFSILFILVLLAVVFGTAWWSYSHLTSPDPKKKWGLILLRCSALAILVLLLLNPFIQFNEIEINNPEIAVYLDNSKSLSVDRGDYEGRERYQEIINSFSLQQFEDITFSYYLFGDQVVSSDTPNPQLEEGLTNLDNVIRHLQDQAGQPAAAIVFSDGIITRGRDPVFAAGELSFPLITVPVGDSSIARDIAITDVMTNRTGYTNTTQPVDVVVRHNGFSEYPVTVELHENDTILGSEQIVMGGDPSSHSLRFDLDFADPGIHEYEIVVPALEGEYTSQNNRYPFTVNVLDDKTRIVHFAFEIHPDVKTIRTLLQTDQSLETIPRTWSGNTFIEGALETIEDNIDLIIIHGPIPGSINGFDDMIADKPILQFVLPSSSLDEYIIPLNLTNPTPEPNIQLRQNTEIQSHPVLEIDPVPLSRQPRLVTTNGTYQVPVTANILFYANDTESETDIPIVITQETGNTRHAVMNAYNWYSYSLSNTDETRQFVQHLITNLVSWTSTNPDNQNLNITPDKQIFSETETVSFQASLKNESGEPEPDAVIEVIISDETTGEQIFTMRSEGQGYYSLDVGRLASGSYTFSAEARKTGRVIDQQTGAFSVETSNMEFINTQRNDPLLRQLADVTNGHFLDTYSAQALVSELESRNLLNPVVEQRVLYRFLYENIWWFIVVILLLSGEWLLRRSIALP